MRDKILAQLKLKFPGVNLSKARLDTIVDKLATKITDETQIEAKLDELNDIMPFADIARQDDRLRTLEANAKNAKPQPKPDAENGGEGGEGSGGKNDDTPAWAKSLMQQVESLKADKTQTGMRSRLAEKLKDVPASYYAKRALPEKDEDLEAFIEEVKTDYTAFKQELVNDGLAVQAKPVNGEDGGKPAEKAVLADIKDWSDKEKVKSAAKRPN